MLDPNSKYLNLFALVDNSSTLLIILNKLVPYLKFQTIIYDYMIELNLSAEEVCPKISMGDTYALKVKQQNHVSLESCEIGPIEKD
jgi:hypothetical protein